MIYTVLPYKEVVIHATDAWPLGGAWRLAQDPTAAEGYRVRHPNAGAPKLETAVANPVDYVDFSFPADPTQTYKLWIRGKADGNSWANDSVHIQFSGARRRQWQPRRTHRIHLGAGLQLGRVFGLRCLGLGLGRRWLGRTRSPGHPDSVPGRGTPADSPADA